MSSTSHRRTSPPRGSHSPARLRVLALAAGVTLCVVAWGYLVLLAIDFGTMARAGNGGGWAMLALAAVGAVACLFVGLILVTRLLTALRGEEPTSGAAPPRVRGGKRAAR